MLGYFLLYYGIELQQEIRLILLTDKNNEKNHLHTKGRSGI